MMGEPDASAVSMKRLARKCRGALGAIAILSCFALPVPANAGLFDDEEARKAILDLRQKVEVNRLAFEQALAKATEDGNRKAADERAKAADDLATMRRGMLDLANQVETLRADLARLRGQDEQLARDVADMQRRQKDLAQGVDDRMRRFEPIKVSVDGRDFLADPAEKREFDAAMVVFRKGEFGASQGLFIEFAKRFPNSGYLPSLLFWLGNAQYATKDYRESIANFRDFLKRAADGARAPEALLGIANNQLELKDPRAARVTLNELVTQYPQSEAASAAKDRLSKLK